MLGTGYNYREGGCKTGGGGGGKSFSHAEGGSFFCTSLVLAILKGDAKRFHSSKVGWGRVTKKCNPVLRGGAIFPFPPPSPSP